MKFKAKVVHIIRFYYLGRLYAFLIPYGADHFKLREVLLPMGGVFLINWDHEVVFMVMSTKRTPRNREESVCNFAWPFSIVSSYDCNYACSILPITKCYRSINDYVESNRKYMLFNLI